MNLARKRRLRAHAESAVGTVSRDADPNHWAETEHALFLLEAEELVEQLENGSASDGSSAAQIVTILKRVLARETGSEHPELAFGTFLSKVWGSSAQLQLFLQLYYHAQTIRLRDGLRSRRSEISRSLIAALKFFLKWYSARRNSLALLSQNHLYHSEQSTLFGCRIRHAVVSARCSGFQVQCNVRMLGLAGRTVWVRALLESHGQHIVCRRGWEGWSDNIDGQLQSTHPTATPTLAALIPLEVEGNRVIADGVSLFIPYAAADLSPGRHLMQVEVELCDEGGQILAVEQVPTNFLVAAEDADVAPIPSPQHFSRWPVAPVSGDALSNAQALYNKTDARIRVSADLQLCGHDDSHVTLECRFLDTAGRSVCGASLHSQAQVFTRSLSFPIDSAYVHLPRLLFEVPLSALAPVPSPRQLLSELTLFDQSGKVLLGAVVAVSEG